MTDTAPPADLARLNEIAPWLNASGHRGAEPLPVGAVEFSRDVSGPLWRDGYFALRPHFERTPIDRLARGVEALTRCSHPPVSIFMFDEAWDLVRAVAPIARYLLGDTARLLPHLWAWHVGPGGTRSGWPPHCDADGETVLDAGGMEMLMSLSLWIPLTDATPENGCMTVLPSGAAPGAGRPLPICLPAPAGSVLGWRQDVWHWGGTAREVASGPRLSLALEFQAGFVDPPLATPLIDPDHPPAPELRRHLVESQIDKYRHME
ncbi:phytanoyl-CoA dioxygenase family protein [Fodinicurvata sp. EGI_FJ10296]|uniref:phytanoyl-CoA dioxygenase family protein n=1 Tax=Fodinicurvata sp. EGI_FJ10296 TaxID=3231908 RepID=UPI0034573A0D